MLIIGAIVSYVVTAVLIVGALLTSEQANTNFKEACYCILTGVFWPLGVPMLAGALFYSNVMEAVRERRREEAEQLRLFTGILHKLDLYGDLAHIYITTMLRQR